MPCLVNAMGIVECEGKYRLVSRTQVICGYTLHLFPERRQVDRNGSVNELWNGFEVFC